MPLGRRPGLGHFGCPTSLFLAILAAMDSSHTTRCDARPSLTLLLVGRHAPKRRTAVPSRYRSVTVAAAVLAVAAALAASAGGMPPGPAEPEDRTSPAAGPEVSPQEEQQPAESFVIAEGQVTDHIGAGQEGVTVTVRRKPEADREGELIATTTTDAFGDFTVTAPEPVRGDVVITFTKPDYVPLIRELPIGEDDEFPPFLAETLEGSLQLTGRVIDAVTKQPLPGASVKLTSMYKDWHAAADNDGHFTIKGVFPGAGELIVEAKRYGRQRQPVPRLEEATEHVVSLKPERIVNIKTLDEDGQPIAGVTVECYDQQRDDFRTAVTDKTGSLTLRGLHFDTAELNLRLPHEDYVSSEGFDHDGVTPVHEAESTHEVVMVRAGRISGLVTDSKTGDPLNGARVMTGEGYLDASPRDWSDDRGRYTIHGVRSGAKIVTVHLSGYAPELAAVQVKAGETSRLDVQLRPGAVLTGLVKSESGEPVAGAYVETGRWRGHDSLGLRAVTGKDGRFVIDNAPHDEFEITVHALRISRVTATVKAGSTTPVEITLPGAPAGAGRPAAAKFKVGEPVPDFEMTTLAGKTVSLASLKGKTILLDFWATWCGPCVVDVPHFLKVHERFGGRGDFVMISVSLDWDEKLLRKFVEEHKMTWHQVFGETSGAQAAADRYGVGAIPAVFLTGPDGKLIASDLLGEGIVSSVEDALKDE